MLHSSCRAPQAVRGLANMAMNVSVRRKMMLATEVRLQEDGAYGAMHQEGNAGMRMQTLFDCVASFSPLYSSSTLFCPCHVQPSMLQMPCHAMLFTLQMLEKLIEYMNVEDEHLDLKQCAVACVQNLTDEPDNVPKLVDLGAEACSWPMTDSV